MAKRIGIVGSDNSHAVAYSKLINREQVVGDAARVVGIWGQEPARTEEVAGLGDIPTIYPNYEAMVGEIDLAFVVDRHGDLHAEHALPFLEAGVDTFVDKPFAIKLDDCRRMLDAAAASGAFLTSMSSLRVSPDTDKLAQDVVGIGSIVAAQFAGPCDFSSVYGGPIFYATHVAEMALRLFDDGIESLAANRTGETVIVDTAWTGDRQATFTYLHGAAYHFGGILFGTEGVASGSIRANDEGYAAVVKTVLAAINSGQRPLTDDQLLLPIAIVHALERSLASNGQRIAIADVLTV